MAGIWVQALRCWLAVVATIAATSALAQAPNPTQPAASANYSAADHARGMAEAPGLLEAAGVRCPVTAAAFVGRSSGDAMYEAACAGGLGWLVIAAKDQPVAVDCLAARSTGRLSCLLPANLRLGGDLAALARRAGVTDCEPSRVAYLGELAADKLTRYEVACVDGLGLLIDLARPGDPRAPRATDCMNVDPAEPCALTSHAQRVAHVARRAAASVAASCRISDARLVGRLASSGASLYELACGADQPGLLVELPAAGATAKVTPCADAARFRAACELKGRDEVGADLAYARDPDRKTSVVANPSWLRKPSAEDVARVFPDSALKRGVQGQATMTCRVVKDGSLTGCTVDFEAPLGLGFGEATLKLANRFKMSERTADGAPTEGGSVRIPVRFNLPGF